VFSPTDKPVVSELKIEACVKYPGRCFCDKQINYFWNVDNDQSQYFFYRAHISTQFLQHMHQMAIKILESTE